MLKPAKVTAGQWLINELLPEDLRNYSRPLDKAGLTDLLRQVAERYPDRYREISFHLNRLGEHAAIRSGGNSVGLQAIKRARTAQKSRAFLETAIAKLLDRDDLNDESRDEEIIKLLNRQSSKQKDEIFDESLAEGNPLAKQIASGARGNKLNLASLRGSDMLYTDHRDRVIPLPILKSYSEGLSPAEYWAGAYGARRGVLAAKFCLTYDTPVLMADYTVKFIKDLVVGDIVMGADLAGQLFPTKVKAIFETGKQECFHYRFRVGSCHNRFVAVSCTPEHKILARVRSGRSPTKAIPRPTVLPVGASKLRRDPTKNEFIACPSSGVLKEVSGLHEEPLAFLVGMMLGRCCDPDWLSRQYLLTTADSDLVKQTSTYLKKFQLQWTEVENKTGPRHILTFEGQKAAKVLETLSGFDLCRADHEKQLPNEVGHWSNESVIALLGGLFSVQCDIAARVGGLNIRFCATSAELVSAVQRLLEIRFGIWTSDLLHTPQRQKLRARHDQFSITISHSECVQRFAKKIPLVGSKKLQLRQKLEKCSDDTAPIGFKVYARERLGLQLTRDIEVGNKTHLFCLANGLVVSNSTAEAGFLSKQLNQVSHRLVIEDEDESTPSPFLRGLPTDINDVDNEGSLLAMETGGYPRNTVLTNKVLADIKRKGVRRLLVRSPITSGGPNDGVYARDVGVRERGGLPTRGEIVGLTAAQALAEPLTQGQLSAKHAGGVAGSDRSLSGFDWINQLVQVPKVFKGGAAHAQKDGVVEEIEKAPAGGYHVMIEGAAHYVPATMTPKVNVGDTVEAGDILSDGIPNPAEVVFHKGIGEGRRYFTEAMREAFRASNLKVHRRNVELLARGLINHVRLSEEIGDGLPDDIVPYATLERSYAPRVNSQRLAPRAAKGKYLEQPALHYSIGTPIRPSVVKTLEEFGVKEIQTNDEPPPFEAAMVRGMANLSYDPDWMTRMFGSGLKRSLLSATHRGGTSDPRGSSFVPGLAKATEFGRQGVIRTPAPIKSILEPSTAVTKPTSPILQTPSWELPTSGKPEDVHSG